jgi:hypothetical protein
MNPPDLDFYASVEAQREYWDDITKAHAPLFPDSSLVRLHKKLRRVLGKDLDVVHLDLINALLGPDLQTELMAAVYEANPYHLEIDGTWLVEIVGRHTCGTADGGHFGAHERGCGSLPVDNLATMPGWDELVNVILAAQP